MEHGSRCPLEKTHLMTTKEPNGRVAFSFYASEAQSCKRYSTTQYDVLETKSRYFNSVPNTMDLTIELFREMFQKTR